MQIKQSYTSQEIDQMRQENKKMTKGVSFSQKDVASHAKISDKDKREVKQWAASAMQQIRVKGALKGF
jgi:hypothetical protein